MNLGLTTRHEDRKPIRTGIMQDADDATAIESAGRDASYRRPHHTSKVIISRSRSEQCAAQSATKCSDASSARSRWTFSPDDGAGKKSPKKSERRAFILNPLSDSGDGRTEETKSEPSDETQTPRRKDEGSQALPERDRQPDVCSSVRHE